MSNDDTLRTVRKEAISKDARDVISRGLTYEHDYEYDNSAFGNYISHVTEELDDLLSEATNGRYGIFSDTVVHRDGLPGNCLELQEFSNDDTQELTPLGSYDAIFLVKALILALKEEGKSVNDIVEIFDKQVRELKDVKQNIKDADPVDKMHIRL